MPTARSESQPPQFNRRRSNTAQSIFKPPLRIGDSKVLISWVHDTKEQPGVILNHHWWPGVAEGDLVHLSANNAEKALAFLFIVPKDEGNRKHQLQISVPRAVADRFGLKNTGEVSLTKVDPEKWCADYIEINFQDQYLGRNEMWRLETHLVGQCVYVDEEISFLGVISAKVQSIYIDSKKVSAAYVAPRTKVVFRSLSAKVTIFIQVCRELWEFAGDGERYNEKIVHSFLPALFAKWRESLTTHIVTIVLVSRVFYDELEIDYAAGPLQRDDEGKWYKDFYKVITDLEVIHDWKPTLVDLKGSFWAFQHDILLADHHHRATLLSPPATPPHARLVGRLSCAHDGPVLEALNLAFGPTETHYIDRSLSLTGSSTIIITPGTGYFRVSKQLLRLTTTRMLDQGFSISLVSLNKPPLHQSPVFCFRGVEPEVKPELSGKVGLRTLDPLWGGDDDPKEYPERERTTFWWEPFWMSVSFWDKQMDLPFREDRFISRAKMHEIEMLGLLDHDVLSSIELPFLPELKGADPLAIPRDSDSMYKVEADKFDMDVFALPQPKPSAISRGSVGSTGSGTIIPSAFFLNSGDNNKRMSTRSSDIPRIPPIEESPLNPPIDLPSDDIAATIRVEPSLLSSMSNTEILSTSPSKSSMRSIHSNKSFTSATTSTLVESSSQMPTPPRLTTTRSRFSFSWLANPFRTGVSQPQISKVSASGLTSPTNSEKSQSATPTPRRTPPAPIPRSPRPPKPMAIQGSSLGRSGLARNAEDDVLYPHRGSLGRHTPTNTPPRDDANFGGPKRRSGTVSSGGLPLAPSASPIVRTNPSKPLLTVPYTMSSLARRWQHLFPQALSKHDIKWKCMITPACLPITVEFFPTASELEASYDVSSYEFVVDPPEMRSFLIKAPTISGTPDTIRRAWALVMMRGMTAQRLAQGFQFVLRPSKGPQAHEAINVNAFRRSGPYGGEEDPMSRPAGAAEVLKTASRPVYLTMSNEIHKIWYSGEAIQLRRYVRRMPKTRPVDYKCLIWPKLGVGYTELVTSFASHGLESYGWNRLDMLVAGYEYQFVDSLRYWRTRFVVIPTDEIPTSNVAPSGETLNDEEIRLMGMDRLADLFSRVRWVAPEDRNKQMVPVRFITTDLDPVSCVLDDGIVSQLADIHANGPLRKKKGGADINEMSLTAIAKAMREEDGVPIKEYKWHGRKYPNSFLGSDLVSWLLREFRDISTREQATEWGTALRLKGLFDHCRGAHGFLDGHYFYTLRGEYVVPMTPRSIWFRRTEESVHRSLSLSSRPSFSGKRRNTLILSQSMVIDMDPNKRSDQAESVILHHDILHNPATCFHFELQWIGTTARCIDDMLRYWGRTIERYGLKLVEAYVTQISDIRDRNPFQSCFPLPLALAPPDVPDLERRVPEGSPASNYFESAILRHIGFVLDIEAGSSYPEEVDVVYSYRRSSFRYSQWVHRSGVAFVQVLGGSKGFLFLTNRLMAPGRLGTALKSQRPASVAEEIREKLSEFCSKPEVLEKFYADQVALLAPELDEPPPLHI